MELGVMVAILVATVGTAWRLSSQLGGLGERLAGLEASYRSLREWAAKRDDAMERVQKEIDGLRDAVARQDERIKQLERQVAAGG